MKRIGGSAPGIGANDHHLAAQLFQPARLTLARELRGLTKAELAERVARTPSALSQFEAARTRPDGRTVGELALALGVPAGFFAMPLVGGIMSVEACHFRSLRSATQRDRRHLLATGTLLCEFAELLEEFAEIPGSQVPVIDQEVVDDADAESVADGVRKAWGLGIGPIPNVVWLLEGKGIIVSYMPNECAEVDAFSGWRLAGNHARPFVFLSEAKGGPARSRFTAAHELGHLVMHHEAQPGNPELERQANQFASAFLMPREAFTREAPRWLNWPLIWELKRRWRVSARAIVRRAFELEVLSEASYRRAFIHLNQTCGMNEPDEPPRESPVVLHRAMEVAEEELTREAVAEGIGLRAADLDRLLDPTGRLP